MSKSDPCSTEIGPRWEGPVLDLLPKGTSAFVYGLRHPVTHEVFWVGSTTDLTARIRSHAFSCKRTHRFVPEMFLLEKVKSDRARRAERVWCEAFIRAGASLRNGIPAGDWERRFVVPSEEGGAA